MIMMQSMTGIVSGESLSDVIGTGDINPRPYWTFEDIEAKLKNKLNNIIYARRVSDRLMAKNILGITKS